MRKRVYNFGQTKPGTELTFLFEIDVEKDKRGRKRRRGYFSCTCGNFTNILLENWDQNHTRSCGHLQKQSMPFLTKKHGYSKHPSARSYYLMLARCKKKESVGYNNYGGRGIQVCERWSDEDNGLRNFIEDMGVRPEGTSLDRVDVNGDYSPTNCRWADRVTQSYNTRRHNTNTSGRTGVYISHYRKDGTPVYGSYISHEDRTISLGTTDDYDLAVERRIEAEIKYKGYEKPIKVI